MISAYIVTEGQTDADVLQKLLPDHLIKDVVFVVGSGKYSAQSLASTLLATRRIPTALIVDADQEAEAEQHDFLHSLLRRVSPGVAFEVFLTVPEIEVILFQDKRLLERLTGRQLTQLEWDMGKRDPKEFLKSVSNGHRLTITSILDKLDQPTKQMLQQHPLIVELSEFLASVAVAS